MRYHVIDRARGSVARNGPRSQSRETTPPEVFTAPPHIFAPRGILLHLRSPWDVAAAVRKSAGGVATVSIKA